MSGQRWRWIWQPGLGEGAELFAFRTVRGGYDAHGDVVATLDDAPLNARYTVEADAEWRTRRVLVELNDGARIEMLSDGAGHWRRADGTPLPELDGCIDPDISITPFTNTLPIRRLGLAVGDAAEIGVAYVLVPQLSLHAAPQRYTRLGDRLWRFDSLDSGFTADISVDEAGFVVGYPGLFRRG